MNRIKIFQSVEEAIKVIPPGEKKKVRIGNIVLCLANQNKRWFAFSDSCPHMQESLSRGTINHQDEIVCPWHSYRFNLSTGEESRKRCADLTIYEVITGDGLFIELSNPEVPNN